MRLPDQRHLLRTSGNTAVVTFRSSFSFPTTHAKRTPALCARHVGGDARKDGAQERDEIPFYALAGCHYFGVVQG